MSGGILLAIAGVWVLSQTFGGNALRRLTILAEDTEATQPTSAGGTRVTLPLGAGITVPAPGRSQQNGAGRPEAVQA